MQTPVAQYIFGQLWLALPMMYYSFKDPFYHSPIKNRGQKEKKISVGTQAI